MNKLQKLHEFLTELQTGVQGKIKEEKKEKPNYKSTGAKVQYAEYTGHMDGQLYEINYILDNFWRIINEN